MVEEKHSQLKALIDSYTTNELKALLLTVAYHAARNRDCNYCNDLGTCSTLSSECIYKILTRLNTRECIENLKGYV
jgi:hypothetical protein